MGVIINELFHSIQGEGLFSGIPTIFIRTTGCDLRCEWCDTTYAFEEGEEREIDEILSQVEALAEKHGHRNICLTGGEPLIQAKVPELIFRLLTDSYEITLETNGSQAIASLLQFIHTRCSETEGNSNSGERFLDLRERLHISLDIKCPGSGESKKMNLLNLNLLSEMDQLKFVVKDMEDIGFAFDILKENPVFCPAIFQPVSITDSIGGHISLEALANTFIDLHPGHIDARFMLQSHRIIWGERRGV